MVKKFAVSSVFVVAAILGYAATKPDTFRVERTISIKAQPKRVFPLLTNFHAWCLWSPWERLDPTMTRTFSGRAKGEGAVYEWAGDRQVGAVRVEIVRAVPLSRVVMMLDLRSPVEGHDVAEYTLKRRKGVTTVTWALYGPVPYPEKVLGLFVDMDRVIGRQVEDGLANLKSVAE
jgi:uncharacterized protein YndB with AHSA1/START domain